MTKQVQRLFDIEYKARERGRKALRGEPMKQRAPMKPISAWLVMDPEDGPTYLSLSDEKDLAEMSLLPKRGQYVVPVEIRERPNPRRTKGKK